MKQTKTKSWNKCPQDWSRSLLTCHEGLLTINFSHKVRNTYPPKRGNEFIDKVHGGIWPKSVISKHLFLDNQMTQRHLDVGFFHREYSTNYPSALFCFQFPLDLLLFLPQKAKKFNIHGLGTSTSNKYQI